MCAVCVCSTSKIGYSAPKSSPPLKLLGPVPNAKSKFDKAKDSHWPLDPFVVCASLVARPPPLAYTKVNVNIVSWCANGK